MRPFLNRLYAASLWLAAATLVVIAALVAVQVFARLIDVLLKAVGQPPFGFAILSLPEIAGYLLAVGSCLALAGTLKAGAHIRVTMALSAMGESRRRVVEAAIHAAGVILSIYLFLAVALLAWDSFKFNEVSTGLVRIPLVWPQAAMAVGFIILAIAFLDEFLEVVRNGRPSYRVSEDAITIGKEG